MAYFNQHQSMISKRYLTFFSKSKKKKPFSGTTYWTNIRSITFPINIIILSSTRLTWKGVYVLAITLWIATWWITEAIPMQQRAYYQLCYYH